MLSKAAAAVKAATAELSNEQKIYAAWSFALLGQVGQLRPSCTAMQKPAGGVHGSFFLSAGLLYIVYPTLIVKDTALQIQVVKLSVILH